MPLRVRRVEGLHAAIGLALVFLAGRKPFAAFSASELARTVAGQVRRGHCLMAFEGDRIVGYLGWACFSRADALEFRRTQVLPPESRADGTEVVWLLTAAASAPGALRLLLSEGRARYPGWRVMGVRHQPGRGAVQFDVPIQARFKGNA